MIIERNLCKLVKCIIPSLLFTMIFQTFLDLTMDEYKMKHVGNNMANQ